MGSLQQFEVAVNIYIGTVAAVIPVDYEIKEDPVSKGYEESQLFVFIVTNGMVLIIFFCVTVLRQFLN